jgi:hypothetical protein
MVAITVILAAVIGTFVLDLGEDVEENARAGFTIDQEPGVSVTIEVNSLGNLGSLRLQDADGSQTFLAQPRTYLQTGLRYELSDAGFSNQTLNNEAPGAADLPDPSLVPLSGGASSVTIPPEAYGECRIVHGKDVIESGGDEIFVDGVDIPCTRDPANPTGTLIDTLSNTDDFEYQEDAEYKVLGSVEGKQQGLTVIQTFETEEG